MPRLLPSHIRTITTLGIWYFLLWRILSIYDLLKLVILLFVVSVRMSTFWSLLHKFTYPYLSELVGHPHRLLKIRLRVLLAYWDLIVTNLNHSRSTFICFFAEVGLNVFPLVVSQTHSDYNFVLILVPYNNIKPFFFFTAKMLFLNKQDLKIPSQHLNYGAVTLTLSSKLLDITHIIPK